MFYAYLMAPQFHECGISEVIGRNSADKFGFYSEMGKGYRHVALCTAIFYFKV